MLEPSSMHNFLSLKLLVELDHRYVLRPVCEFYFFIIDMTRLLNQNCLQLLDYLF